MNDTEGPFSKQGRRAFERDAFGFPVTPPGRVTVLANAMRRGLARTTREAAPPPLRILEALFGQFDAYALRALIETNVVDLLDAPTSIADLAAATGTDPPKLRRLLRYGAGRGFVAIDKNDHVLPTPLSMMLRSDAPSSWRGWIEFLASDFVTDAFGELGPSLAAGDPPPFDLAHGQPFFEYTTHTDREAGRAFDRAMEAGSTAQAVGLGRALDWSAVHSVCDVGGGTGAALDVLQRYQPHIAVTLVDLPEVVAHHRLQPVAGLNERTIVGASFFEPLPRDHDRYMLLAIIHDWDDEHARTILANIHDAMRPRARVIVVENVLSDRPRDDFANATDLLMYVLATGRERTRREYDGLFAATGFRVESSKPIVSGATAFTLAQT